ncbi:MAG TPA: N-acetyltransferase [Arenicellales bacterium]|jgi:amino-acid N-acetyltransferase|nr:N-acetyltransferase [Arenicellales bacterium]HJP26568.1 N-acetyltransferase [Arenicellales bacterium]|tara:strand:- start:482 stop:952 length:471 start_codon:yes stop_codon:yes gene_type:complete
MMNNGSITIRPATIGDVPAIHHLIEVYAEEGKLLHRPMNELYRHLREFFIAERDSKVIGCGALEIYTEHLGEIRSLAVDPQSSGEGVGREITLLAIDEARKIGLHRLMALTYVPGFFHKLGFKTVDKSTLPEKIWGVCIKCSRFNDCDETAAVMDL